jgi:chemotaxis protein MotA
VVIGVVKGMIGTLKGSPYSKAFYLEQLKMLNDVFTYARKNGLVKLEADVEEPDKSPLFANYKTLLSNHHALNFICDTLRMAISGGVGHFEIDQMMELDMEVHHHEAEEPVHALNTMSDALPGLGIVAAVLGIVITMNSLGGPVEEVGHHVAAALVGTFLGILMCYGFFGRSSRSPKKSTTTFCASVWSASSRVRRQVWPPNLPAGRFRPTTVPRSKKWSRPSREAPHNHVPGTAHLRH